MSTAPVRKKSSIDRLIKGCFKVFVASLLVLVVGTIYSIAAGKMGVYLSIAAIAYFLVAFMFLTIVSIAFLKGHLGTSKEIEQPKLDIFKLEENWDK